MGIPRGPLGIPWGSPRVLGGPWESPGGSPGGPLASAGPQSTALCDQNECVLHHSHVLERFWSKIELRAERGARFGDMIFRCPCGALGRQRHADERFVEAKRSVSTKVSVSSRRNGLRGPGRILGLRLARYQRRAGGGPGGVGEGKPSPLGYKDLWIFGCDCALNASAGP